MKNLAFPVLMLLVLALAACGGGSAVVPTPVQLLSTPEALPDSPRPAVEPDAGLPPTWTPAPAAEEGHIFPVSGAPAEDGAPPSVPVSGTRTVYTVEAGDTLGTIAERYGVSVSDLALLNDIDNIDQIEVGQQLIIPVAGDDG